MPELAIIADDLTGALDTAAPFAMRGLSTHAALGVDSISEALSAGPRVLTVSTDSREVAPDIARKRVAEIVAVLPKGTKIFKKIDSRLKGNIAAELGALPHARSLVIPAIPAFKRLVVNGHLTGFGVDSPISVAGALGEYASRAHIPDIATDADIDAALDGDYDLLIGARGLADAFSRRLSNRLLPQPDHSMRPAYVVIGSTDLITLGQVEALCKAHPEIDYIPAPNGQADIAGPLKEDIILLHATPGDRSAPPSQVASALASSLQALVACRPALLVLSGGATAQAVLRRFDVNTLEVLGEALPGLPVSRSGHLTVVTKSGGFGSSDTLVHLLSSAATEAR